MDLPPKLPAPDADEEVTCQFLADLLDWFGAKEEEIEQSLPQLPLTGSGLYGMDKEGFIRALGPSGPPVFNTLHPEIWVRISQEYQ